MTKTKVQCSQTAQYVSPYQTFSSSMWWISPYFLLQCHSFTLCLRLNSFQLYGSVLLSLLQSIHSSAPISVSISIHFSLFLRTMSLTGQTLWSNAVSQTAVWQRCSLLLSVCLVLLPSTYTERRLSHAVCHQCLIALQITPFDWRWELFYVNQCHATIREEKNFDLVLKDGIFVGFKNRNYKINTQMWCCITYIFFNLLGKTFKVDIHLILISILLKQLCS